jgi:UDP-Gal:alpha-D-GlcNAc-diphosphoundecaprenol beta-1,4-galactosyltransferase
MITMDEYIEKVASSIPEMLPGKNKMFTFMSYYNYEAATKSNIGYDTFTAIGVDGILLVLIFNKLLKIKRFNRISFDMTSLAPVVFKYAIDNRKSIYFIGSRTNEITNFVSNVKIRYPELAIKGFRGGYFSNGKERADSLLNIINSNADIVIIGMGCPLQDEYSLSLHEHGFKGTSYTCGGFFHQFQMELVYYPDFINKYHLRLLYRIIKEKYVLRRTIVNILFFMRTFVKEYPKVAKIKFKNRLY